MFAGFQLATSLCLVDKLDPVSQGAGAVNMAAVDMLFFNRVLYTVQVGAVGGAGTIDFKLQGSILGTSTWVDLTGRAITQITAANKVAKVGVTAEDVGTQPATSGVTYFRYVRGVLTVGTNAVLIAVTAYASIGRYRPEVAASGKELSAVTQTIADAN
jgi:hypothetical protein